MLGEIPKLFDRAFAIAFFLPATIMGISSCGILSIFHHFDAVRLMLGADILVGAALGATLIWILALFLLAMNYQIYRFYEGYGKYHPLKWRMSIYRTRFERAKVTVQRQADLDASRLRGEEPIVPEGHPARLLHAVANFPDSIIWVLPTRFGNTLRAFEVYPRVIYGLDSIPAWPLIQAVIPEHARKLLTDSKAKVDFCVNLSLSGWIMMLLYFTLSLLEGRLHFWWVPCIAGLVGFGAYCLAVDAAAGFGAYVKSAFDLYRADLAHQLGLEVPRSIEKERAMWNAVSRMIIYRSPARADELVRFRPHTPPHRD